MANEQLTDIINRLNWMDEERRKSNRRMTELEQRITLQQREIDARDQRIQKLEERLASARHKLANLEDIEARIRQLRSDMVNAVEDVNVKRKEAQGEIERLRTVERQITNRELGEIRKELPAIGRLQDQIDQRKTEDTRLLQMIGNLQNRFPHYDTRIDSLTSSTTYVEEGLKQAQRQFSQLETKVLENGQRAQTNHERLDSINLKQTRFEASLHDALRTQDGSEQQIRQWLEQAKAADLGRQQQINRWDAQFESYSAEMQKFHQEFLRLSDQAKEARAITQGLGEWRKTVERQQREQAELVRVENNRMSNRWEEFLNNNDKFVKQLEIQAQQQQQQVDRRHTQMLTQIHDLEEKLAGLRTEKEMLLRVQTAQADAIKQFPTLWLEEVEKAIANDPNRRRSPALAPTPDEY